MCVEPKPFPHPVTGVPFMRACRHCWACRKNRVKDYVGRCFAEAQASTGVSCINLTYGGDVPGSVILLYSDVQKLWKRLRKAGHPLRYVAAGEHGSRHGRAHWHLIVFWQGSIPELPPFLLDKQDWKFWPHGFVHHSPFQVGSAQYALKYLLKDQFLETQVSRFALSKKPPLGRNFFYGRADDLVERRIAPTSLAYRVPGALSRKGKPLDFWLRGRMAELFIDRWSISWRQRWHETPPNNEFLDDFYHRKFYEQELEKNAMARFAGRLSAQA